MVDEPSSPRHAMTLVATGLGLFMIFLDATIVNVALPDIQTEFDVGESGIQWVVAAYSLTMAMFMMSSATLADLRGRRITYVVGIAVFALASIGCALAPSIMVLNLSRGLQGVGAAIVNVTSLALVGAAFTDPGAKARAIGAWTGIAAVGLAIGPTVGGVLTETFGWRSIFVVNPVVGALAIVLTLRFVSESKDPTHRRFDLAGQVLFIAGVGLITYVLVEGPQEGWTSPLILGLLATSIALTVFFVVIEMRIQDPMMDVRVFADRIYTTAILTIFVVLFAIYGTMLVITQYFQNIRDYSPEQAGLLMLAMTVPTVVGAPLAGRATARIGGRRPTLLGVACIFFGTSILALTTGGPIVFTLLGLAFTGVAGGLAVAPATSVAMSSIPPERSGMASGILSAQRALGSTAGFAIMGTVLAAVVASVLPGAFEPYLTDEDQRDEAVEAVVDAANPQAVTALIAPKHPLADDVAEESELVDAADDAFVDGIRAAIAVASVLLAAVFVAGWRIFPRHDPAEVDEAVEAEALEALETGTPRRSGVTNRPQQGGS